MPDCALTNPVANGECGAMANPNFGATQPDTTYDPDLLRGWGKREYARLLMPFFRLFA